MDWLRTTAVPWARNTFDGRNDPTRTLTYQQDGARPHIPRRVSNTIQQLNACSSKIIPLQVIKYLGQEFDGRVWALDARDILSDANRPPAQRQPHPNWQRAFNFPPYSPDIALMDFFVWPEVNKKVLIHCT